MVNLRGITPRGYDQIRKFNRKLSTHKLQSQLFQRVLQGDSLARIRKDLQLGGVTVSRLTLERTIFDRYGARTISRYYNQRALRYGSHLGFSANIIQRLSGSEVVKVRVRGVTKDGEIIPFDVHVRIGEGLSLQDAIEQLEEIYLDAKRGNSKNFESVKAY